LRNCGLRDLTAITLEVALLGLWPLQAGATLVLSPDGTTVYDTVNNVGWLAEANLAATNRFGLPLCMGPSIQTCVNASGSMRYDAAVAWVQAMNAANYLGHSNWQLPTTPTNDSGCGRTGPTGANFGFGCSASAFGSLWNTLGLKAPNTAVAIPSSTLGPFSNFQPYLYWSQSSAPPPSGNFTFSFATGWQGANTLPNFLYALPMIAGKLAGTPPATGNGLEVNPGGQTVYDPVTNITWLANANLAATNTFGLSACTDPTTPALCVAPDGAMTFASASQFIVNMNAFNGAGYLGQSNWQLPPISSGCPGYNCVGNQNPMGNLFYNQLHFSQGMTAVTAPNIAVGPFHNIQPYLYWTCGAPTIQAACQANGPAPNFEWSYSFGSGFEGTDLLANDLYVTAYFVGPPPSPPTISLSNTQLQFWDYVAQSSLTPPQAVGVSNTGGGTLSFTATPDAPWINVASTSSGFTVAANPAGLGGGPHSGTISVTAPGATNTPQTVTVTLIISASAQIPPSSAARFVPVTPCRMADTRNATGPFGGPGLPRQTVGRAEPGGARHANVPDPGKFVRAARECAGVLLKLRRCAKGGVIGIPHCMAGGKIPATGGLTERSNRHCPVECGRRAGGNGWGGRCVFDRRDRSGDRHQRVLRACRRWWVVPVHGGALPGAGFATAGRNAALPYHSGRECHGESVRRAGHGPGFCVQRDGGASGILGLHHHVAAGAVPTAGGHPERL
jgi:hypothetical protein